jgi:hypothetical protein
MRILPGQKLDGGIVVASVIINEEDYDDVIVMALLLMPTPGSHYRVVDVKENDREVLSRRDFPNIVPAVEDYQENGGDY